LLCWLTFSKKIQGVFASKISGTLHRGTTYEFEMYVRLAFWSNASLKSIGALFTKMGYKGKNDVVKSALIDSVSPKKVVLLTVINGLKCLVNI
jgi:hypothetical protein